jgi:hypothetical protein
VEGEEDCSARNGDALERIVAAVPDLGEPLHIGRLWRDACELV